MTKSDEALKIMKIKGYYIDNDGNLYNPKGEKKKLGISKAGYYRFSIRGINNERLIGFMHRYVGYTKFGDQIFDKSLVIRHLDGNPLNNKLENIAIGSPSDNMMDINIIVRKRRSKYAAKKYSDEFIENLRNEYNNGMPFIKLREKYNLPKSTMSYYLSKTAKKRVWELI